ncbi:NAD(P)H-dependent oxidoreductase [Paraburkholderia tuberum]|uniref:NAD(P)H-dependent oxidoreductase n=1 Tax=Paraburkholderia tuberum TaxID=157910 RepID=UPI000B284447
MNVFIIYAHPEPKSLNGSLKDFTVRHLERAGHTVQASDLYAMNRKASLDAHDTSERHSGERFVASLESKHAFENGLQSEDIAREHHSGNCRITASAHFSVYAYGLAYDVGEHSDARWGERYGEGRFAGKRAMLIVTTGDWESHYSARGINGPIDDVLFPIQHGVLYYPGFEVLPPFVVYRTSRVDDAKYAEVSEALGRRLDTL